MKNTANQLIEILGSDLAHKLTKAIADPNDAKLLLKEVETAAEQTAEWKIRQYLSERDSAIGAALNITAAKDSFTVKRATPPHSGYSKYIVVVKVANETMVTACKDEIVRKMRKILDAMVADELKDLKQASFDIQVVAP